MKFGAQLELYAIPQWKDKYIRYDYLKKYLYKNAVKLKVLSNRSVSLERRGSLSSEPSVIEGEYIASTTSPLLSATSPGLNLPSTSSESSDACNRVFLVLLDDELKKVEQHFAFESSFLIDRLMGVKEELHKILEEDSLDEKEISESHLNTIAATNVAIDGNVMMLTDMSTTAAAAAPTTSGQSSEAYPQAEKKASLLNMKQSGVFDLPSEKLRPFLMRDSLESQSECATSVMNQGDSQGDDVLTSNKADIKSKESYMRKLVLGIRERRLSALEIKRDKERQKELAARKKARESHKRRLCRAIIEIWDSFDKLEGFVQLNVVTLYKILKKRDKLLGMKRLNVDLLEKKRRLSLSVVQQSIKDTLLNLYNSIVSKGDTETPSDMQNLAMLAQKHFVSARPPVSFAWITFFLGACLIIFIDIAFAAILPATNPYFSMSALLTLLPIFRLSLMCVLMAWGAGCAVAVFEYYGVNYKFILDIDPKCQVSAWTLLSFASVLTSIWVIGFAAFVMDSKFGLFLTPNQMAIYPLLVILFQIMVFFVPSKTFRWSYKKNLLIALEQTLRSSVTPGSKVTLVHNITGDILTSLSKPLLDLEYTLAYYIGLILFVQDPTRFAGRLDAWLLPLITVFPYWLRLIQCYSRYRTEDKGMRSIHSANMGKYFSTIVVVIVSSIRWEDFGMSIYAARLLFVFVYLFASLYNLIWDIVMDWGLMPDPDHFVRPDQSVMYPQWLYYLITFFNIIGRLTWALTLVPIGILDDHNFNIFFITLAISAIELLRRSAWLILRLENEHLTNSSRYRAMLWVPKLNVSIADYNPLIQDEKTTDARIQNALKRFVSMQVDKRAPTINESNAVSKRNDDIIDDDCVSRSPQKNTSAIPNNSETNAIHSDEKLED